MLTLAHASATAKHCTKRINAALERWRISITGILRCSMDCSPRQPSIQNVPETSRPAL